MDLHIVPTWSVGAGVSDRARPFAGGPEEARGRRAGAGTTAYELLVPGALRDHKVPAWWSSGNGRAYLDLWYLSNPYKYLVVIMFLLHC